MAISIHAPSRERRTSSSTSVQYLYFNPRSLAGATKTKQQMLRQSSHFNPRSLAGATECVPSSDEPKPHFNPRSLAGATAQRANAVSRINISIHAPSRERRLMLFVFVPGLSFQSTLPRGSDAMLKRQRSLVKYFNPRSLAGATAAQGCKPAAEEFQSTLPRGSDDFMPC